MAIICERLRLAILRNVMTDNDGGHFNVTASIGIARISERCSSSMAMQAADGPLYSAKAAGRNRLRFAQHMGHFVPTGTNDMPASPLRAIR